ncbi:peptidase family S66 [Xylogone sp. PMI_703]|nr:peptidase family S66 [Xylogone sp. PMI_703]
MATEQVIPKALRKGDTIALVSPSERLNRRLPIPHQRSIAFLENLGYTVKDIFYDITTTSIRDAILQRCEELHEAFRDPEVKAVITTIGGTTSNELLPYLDFSVIRANPKIFAGFSDITMLHFAISHETGLRTFYGPGSITEFGEGPAPLPFTVNHFFHVLQDTAGKAVGLLPESPQYVDGPANFFKGNAAAETPRELLTAPGWKWLRPGSAQGPIFGGCLTLVVRLSGTKYWPSFKGKILLLESPSGEDGEWPFPIYRARAAIADLINTGIFQDIAGLVIGRSVNYDEKLRKQYADIVTGLLEGTNFPILAEVDIGHTAPMLTVPLNALAKLDSKKNEFSILEPGVVR